jgi:hypothetical protein
VETGEGGIVSRYSVGVDYGHGRDYTCVVIAENRNGVKYVIGEGWHLKSGKLAMQIAIATIRPWWKRWLFKLTHRHS